MVSTLIPVAGTFIGGLGIFLLAMSMITDGLKMAAGNRLKVILERWTTTRLRGLASGVLVTAVVQSSSAVTVATIGFVNAGLLSLGQSLGVVFGSNVGTTMTGWIVAAIGFDFRIEALALPMVGIGMFARMFRPDSRVGELGLAVAGFGLFFLGIDLMKDAFESVASNLDATALGAEGVFQTLTYFLAGVILTVLTQSSSAAIAITLTAATGGLLALDTAAAMVIGTNVGTTSTAALAVLNATANARRVAAAHIIFNLVTGIVALLLLPVMLGAVDAAGTLFGVEQNPAVSLALFHTAFNVLGVALLLPFTTRLVAFLNGRFTTQAELLSRLQFLDSNILATPALALSAINLELERALRETRELVLATLQRGTERDRNWVSRRAGLESLCDAMGDSIANLEMAKLPEQLRGSMPLALRIIAYLEEILSLLDDYQEHKDEIETISRPGVAQDIATFTDGLMSYVARCEPGAANFSIESSVQEYSETYTAWRQLKTGLLEAASARTIPISPLNHALEGIRSTVRTAEQLGKAAQRLHALERD